MTRTNKRMGKKKKTLFTSNDTSAAHLAAAALRSGERHWRRAECDDNGGRNGRRAGTSATLLRRRGGVRRVIPRGNQTVVKMASAYQIGRFSSVSSSLFSPTPPPPPPHTAFGTSKTPCNFKRRTFFFHYYHMKTKCLRTESFHSQSYSSEMNP